MSDDSTQNGPPWGQDPTPPSGDEPQPGYYPPPPPGGYPPNFGNAHQGQQPPPGYGQPSYGQPVHGQPAYGYPYQYAPVPPKHPQATLALVLGILGIAGLTVCVTLFAAPFAWFIGAKAVREIDASQGAYSGRGEAQAGKIMGIIGSVLLILAVLVLVVFIFGLIASLDNNY